MSSAVQTASIPFYHARGRSFCFIVLRGIVFGLLTFTTMVQAFEQLTAAQNLVYDQAHLSNTTAGQQINYRYHSQKDSEDAISDRVSLLIRKAYEGDKRDVALEFLSNERRVPFPDFNAFRGNPVIIAMLEHIAQSFGRDTGGGVLYFRNRIRDALANKNTQINQISAEYNDKAIDAKRIIFSPFVGDPYLAEKPEYTKAIFSITLSSDVPGGVVSVTVSSSHQGGTYLERKIVIE